MRLKQKVTKLEALLARSCERLRSTNVLKHGLEYQMTGKVRLLSQRLILTLRVSLRI